MDDPTDTGADAGAPAHDEAPVPFRMVLPSSAWRPTDPASVGVSNALFFALRADTPGDYTPSLTVSGGWRSPGVSLTQVADECLEKLRLQGLTDVELVRRRKVESEHAPAVAQTLGGTAAIDGVRHDIRQLQAVFGYVDVASGRTAVLIHSLTCTYAQEVDLAGEWRDYVASITVVAADAG